MPCGPGRLASALAAGLAWLAVLLGPALGQEGKQPQGEFDAGATPTIRPEPGKGKAAPKGQDQGGGIVPSGRTAGSPDPVRPKDERGDIDRIFEILRRLPPVVLLPGQPPFPGRPEDLGPAAFPGGAGGGRQPSGEPGGQAAGGAGGGGPAVGPLPGLPLGRPAPPSRLGAPAPVGPVLAAGEQRDRVVVVSLPDAPGDDLDVLIGQEFGLERETGFRSVLLGARIVRYRIPDDRPIATVLAQIAARAAVVAVQPEYVYRPIQGAGGAATAGPQYAIDKMRIGEAHRIALGRNVRIAVIDTGIDASHPEIKGALAESFDAVGEGSAAAEGHGTAIAGILAAHGQLTGMAPEARIVSVRAFSATGAKQGSEATTTTIIKGLEWAVIGGTRIINLSFAGPRDPGLELAIARATEKGAILIASAGNAGPSSPPLYPAAYAPVIAVSAVDSSDRVYAMANRGKHIAIAAPGVDILAPGLKGSYDLTSGTSMAAAHVSGVVALLLERRPGLSAGQARELLTRTARPAPGGPEAIGAGVVDAARLLE